MQFTGHAGKHLSQPLQSSGMMTTSAPWLKMAPNCEGQCLRHASQLMHSDISMRSGTFFHFGFRSCASMRSTRVDAAMGRGYRGSHDSQTVAYDPRPTEPMIDPTG